MTATSQNVIWRPHPGRQTQFLENPAYEVLYGGARGGGKTDCILFGALRQVHKKGYRALILRRTFPELREVIDRSIQHFGPLGGHWIASEKRWRFPAGATVEFGYCESVADVMQYQGQEFQYIGFDEIGQVPEERIWDLLLTSVRSSDPEIQKFARASANPGGPGHGWLRKRFILPCPADGTPIYDSLGNTRAFVPARVYDNPSLTVNDPGYVKRLESLPELLRRQHLEGDWEVGTGLAFEGLTDTSHLVRRPSDGRVELARDLDPRWRLFGAFDWGFGHKWAFGLFAIKQDSVVRVVDSVMGRRMVPETIADRVADLLSRYGLQFSDLAYTVAGSDVKIRDEARGTYGPSVLEQFLQYGWVLMPADQSRIAGYQNCLIYLHSRNVEFCDTPGNKVGLDQLQGLVTDPDAPNDVLKTDADPITGEGGDDWYDMWRYGLMSRPMPNIIQKRIKGEVDGGKPWIRPPSRILAPVQPPVPQLSFRGHPKKGNIEEVS